MNVIAVISPPGNAWVGWAKQRQPLMVNANVAAGEGWTAHRCDSFDVPWQGVANEIVILPAHGGFTSLSQALPKQMREAA